MPTLIVSLDPFAPHERTVTRIPKNRRIAAMCPKVDRPVVCFYNGKPLLRAGWSRRVKHGDTVAFVVMPRGGGGFGKMLGAILMVVVAVVAPMIGGQLAAMMGVTSKIGIAMITAGVALVGSMLLNAIMPAPKLPKAYDTPAPSPTYTLSAQGNTARVNEPIPVQYGRMMAYLDYAATPYQEFQDNEQYLYQLLVVGQGHYEVEQIRIEDTPLTNFEGATAEVVPPGQRVTLFPAAVIQSAEVGGAEISGPQGPFSASGPGEEATQLGIDLACPGGVYLMNDEGRFTTLSITVKIEARLLDAEGEPTGAWITLGTETISGATNTAIRRSYRYTVAAGRYQVRVSRLDTKSTSNRAQHAVNWVGLRAYLPDDTDYGDITLLAVKIKATAQISEFATRKINVIGTRKLPTWHPTTGWSAPQPTRSIAWALADICRSSYGASLADDRYDLPALYALDQVWTARGDKFDARYDAKMTIGEALTTTARAGRCKWYRQAGRVRFWRDAPQTVPVMIFQPENIKPGSFYMEYAPAVTDTADGVRLTYIDQRYWKVREATCALPGSAAANLADLNAFGMVERAQVVREGMKIAADNRYRRRFVGFETELESHLLRFGDLVGIVHDVPRWGQSGEVVGWDAATLTATLSNPPEWTGGATHYIRLAKNNGQPTGMIQVSPHASDENRVILAVDPGFVPETVGSRRLRTRYNFGPAGKIEAEALVMGIKPNGRMTSAIECVIEDRRVHDADAATIPDDTAAGYPTVPSAPAVSGLAVAEAGTPAAPLQILTWQAVGGADHYVVEYTTDDSNWARAGDTTGTRWELAGLPPGQYFNARVAAVGLLRGPWAYANGTSGAQIAAPGGLVSLTLESPFTGPSAVIRWPAVPRADRYRVQVWQGGVLRREKTISETRYIYTVEDAKQDGGPWRSFTFWVTPLGIGAGPSSSLDVFNPNVGQLNNVQVTSMATGALWTCTPPNDPDIDGFVVYASQTNGFTPSAANLVYEGKSAIRQLPLEPNKVWYLRCGAYDQWGKDGLQLTGQITVNTGAVSADHLSVANLAAIVANLGEIVAGKMRSADNVVDFDLDLKRLLVRNAGGNELLKLGLLAAGKYGLSVTDPASGNAVTITPGIGTIVAQGTITMPTTLNADGTYDVAVVLPKVFNFADLTVMVDADNVPAYNVIGSWTAQSGMKLGIWTMLSSSAQYREVNATNATGRPTYKAHTVPLGHGNNAVSTTFVVTRWNKGNLTSGNTIYLQGSKNLQVYDTAADQVKSLIEIGWPITINYTVIARNFTI